MGDLQSSDTTIVDYIEDNMVLVHKGLEHLEQTIEGVDNLSIFMEALKKDFSRLLLSMSPVYKTTKVM